MQHYENNQKDSGCGVVGEGGCKRVERFAPPLTIYCVLGGEEAHGIVL